MTTLPHPSRRAFLGAALSAAPALSLCGAAARAAELPSHPLRLVVPYPAGASSDGMSRVVAASMSSALGQPVVIENKGGANGIVAAEQMSKQPPDGYTFMQVAAGMLTINQSIYKSLPYDPIDGFTPLTIAVSMPLILVVNNAQPIRSVADLIALARAKPGTLTYGSSGVGTSMHLAGAMFEVMGKVSMVHVPYRGGAPAMNDLLGNQVTALFDNAPTALAQIRAGTVRAVAVGGNARIAELPNVPTIAESGLPGYNSDTWYGFVMPPKASPQVAAELHQRVVGALADSRAKLEGLGFTVVASSAATMHDTIRAESAKWADVIRRSGIERQ